MKEPYRHNRTRWDQPDREWLEHQHFVLGKTYKQMAEEVGCCRETMLQWAKNRRASWESLVKSGEIHPPFKVGDGWETRFYGVTKEWLEREYFEKGKSAHQVAKEIGTSWNAVVIWLRKHDLEPRSREEIHKRHAIRMSGENNPAWDGGTSMRYQRRMLAQADPDLVCAWCHTREHIEVHHIDHNRDNCDLSNLIWLCGNCNKLESQLWILGKSNRAIVNVNGGKIKIEFREPE